MASPAEQSYDQSGHIVEISNLLYSLQIADNMTDIDYPLSDAIEPIGDIKTFIRASTLVNQPLLDDSYLIRCYILAQVVPHGQCRKCWHDSDRIGAQHLTYDCPSGLLRHWEWMKFKSMLRFPPGALCWFCFSPFQLPFVHSSIPGFSPQECEFPDALKELAFILWHDVTTRQAVFKLLDTQAPDCLQIYTDYLSKRTASGALGIFIVLSAYFDVLNL